jgi:vacuolar-type H+-ATPase subunit E/Vma4
MSLQQILQKILQDAKNEAALLSQKADEEVASLSSQAEKEIESIHVQLDKEKNEKVHQLHKKIENLAQHQQKISLLEKKREILEIVILKSKEKVSALPISEKERIICQALEKLDVEKGIIHPTEGEEEVVKKALKLSKKSFDVGECISGEGGGLLITPTSEVDFRFDSIFDQELSKQMEPEISALLFAK